MSIEGRIESLTRKHKDLHDRIEALEAEHAPDEYIQKLKKEKLALKDELHKLELDQAS
jgi:hypothetical protein